MKIMDDQLINDVKNGKDIYLAGGCFWGTEHYFKQIEGVIETAVGFANGHTANPTYKEVYTDTTGYAETVYVKYNPDVVSLEYRGDGHYRTPVGEDYGCRRYALSAPSGPILIQRIYQLLRRCLMRNRRTISSLWP